MSHWGDCLPIFYPCTLLKFEPNATLLLVNQGLPFLQSNQLLCMCARYWITYVVRGLVGAVNRCVLVRWIINDLLALTPQFTTKQSLLWFFRFFNLIFLIELRSSASFKRNSLVVKTTIKLKFGSLDSRTFYLHHNFNVKTERPLDQYTP